MLATLAGPGPSGLVLEAVSIAKAGLFTPRFMVPNFSFFKIGRMGVEIIFLKKKCRKWAKISVGNYRSLKEIEDEESRKQRITSNRR